MDALGKQLTRLGNAVRLFMEKRLAIADLGPQTWKLPKPRICVMEPKRSRLVLGWYSPQRWTQGAVNLDEIVLTPTAVGKGVFHAAEVLAHELVHLANAVAKRDDTSRQGRYHNDKFRETAEAAGLVVAKNQMHGCCQTELGVELTALVKKLLQDGTVSAHVFKYQRRSARARASLVKLSAPCCGVFAYVTCAQVDAVVLTCGKCGGVLKPVIEDPRCD